ncbi:hypothetical protein CYMTET_14576 [Cymbomonas tetramitiformis]|uniref:Uncharacterized protein n=1 Tax=Cymbomonas tetramitiformis TaxID=36881 RepID=A0AAE0L9V6_9CHLO|nr:hypothetical protein CYMTET_14576 [Cymbomonas tetramitiformis]
MAPIIYFTVGRLWCSICMRLFGVSSLEAVLNQVDAAPLPYESQNLWSRFCRVQIILLLSSLALIYAFDTRVFTTEGYRALAFAFSWGANCVAVFSTHEIGGRLRHPKAWQSYMPFQGGLKFVALQALSWTITAVVLFVLALQIVGILLHIQFYPALFQPFEYVMQIREESVYLPQGGTITCIAGLVGELLMIFSVSAFESKTQKRELGSGGVFVLFLVASTICYLLQQHYAPLIFFISSLCGVVATSVFFLTGGQLWCWACTWLINISSQLETESAELSRAKDSRTGAVGHSPQPAVHQQSWARFCALQVLLMAASLAAILAFELDYLVSFQSHMLVEICAWCAIILAVFSTHRIGGRLRHRARFRFYMPFEGGLRFVILQALSWTLTGIALMLLSMRVLCKLAGIQVMHPLSQAGEWLPSSTLMSVLSGVVAEVFMVSSLLVFEPEQAEEMLDVVQDTGEAGEKRPRKGSLRRWNSSEGASKLTPSVCVSALPGQASSSYPIAEPATSSYLNSSWVEFREGQNLAMLVWLIERALLAFLTTLLVRPDAIMYIIFTAVFSCYDWLGADLGLILRAVVIVACTAYASTYLGTPSVHGQRRIKARLHLPCRLEPSS